MAIYITGTVALQGVTLFLPSIVANMGSWSKPAAQALTVPPYFLAFLVTIAISWSSGNYSIFIFKPLFSNLSYKQIVTLKEPII
jgi:hypothetical protein